MALTIDRTTPNRDTVWGNLRTKFRLVDFDSSYPTGGEDLTPGDFGLSAFQFIVAEPQSGYSFEYDRANEKLLVRDRLWPDVTINLTDDDSAASNGTDVYVHIDEVLEQGSYLAHLESVTANNADTYAALSNGGPHVRIRDDDGAATNGSALFFDEDATGGQRLLADLDNVGDADVFVLLSDGRYIKIIDTDSPGTPGVAVHVDDDAANDYERLLFVSPTDSDGSDTFTSEALPGTDLSSLTDVRVMAVGVR